MNRCATNNAADSLRITGLGIDSTEQLTSLAVDAYGRSVLSPENTYGVQSSGFKIRLLNDGTDSALMTGADIAIRSLRGNLDAVTWTRQSSVTASDSALVSLLTPVNFLPTDLSGTRQNAFVVANMAAVSLSVRIFLQIAPVNIDSYYVDDGTSFDLIGGGIATFVPSKLMRFARIRVTALISTASVEVYFFGRT